jgi:hypothetical protein
MPARPVPSPHLVRPSAPPVVATESTEPTENPTATLFYAFLCVLFPRPRLLCTISPNVQTDAGPNRWEWLGGNQTKRGAGVRGFCGFRGHSVSIGAG